jgi:phage gp29-like protein
MMTDEKKLLPTLEAKTKPRAGHGSLYSSELVDAKDTVLDDKGGSHELFAKILSDDQVKSCIQQRRTALTSKEIEVVAGGDDPASKEAAEFLELQLEKIGWISKASKMHYAIFYGYAVAEIIWEVVNGKLEFKDIAVRKRHRFKFDLNGGLRLLKSGHPNGIELPDRKMWTYNTGADNDDQPYGMGLAHWLYWPCLFKREGVTFWLTFLDKFGSPTVKGTYPTASDQDKIDKLLEACMAAASDAAIALPEGMQIELMEASRGGKVSYQELVDKMDASISKIILSQTMTTDNGSSNSQAQVHDTVKDAVVEADAAEICNSFNQGPVKWITEYNFPNAKLPKVKFLTETQEDLNTSADRDVKILSLGYQPTEEYIHETYGNNYVKVDQTNKSQGQTAPDKKTEFSEHTHDSDDIDNFAEDASQSDHLSSVLQPVMDMINDEDSLENIRDQLIGTLEDMDAGELTEHLARSSFFGRVAAELEAD